MPGALGNYLGWALSNQINQNPALSYLEGVKASSIVPEVALRSAQAQQAMGELEQERQIKTAMQGIDISTPEGQQKGIAAVAKINPMMGLKLQGVLQNLQAEQRKTVSETINNVSKLVKDRLPLVNDGPGYIKLYGDAQTLSGQMDPGLMHPKNFMNPDGTWNQAAFSQYKNQAMNSATMLQAQLQGPKHFEVKTGEDIKTYEQYPGQEPREIATAPRQMKSEKWSFQTVTDNQGNTQIIPINKETLQTGPPIATKTQALSPEATDFLARMMLADPKSLPAMGFGPQMRQPVFNRASQIALQEGINPQDTAIKSAILGTIKTGLGQLEGQTQKIEGFVKTFDKNMAALREQSTRVGRTGTPLLNRYLLWTKGQVAGDPEISSFNVLLKSVANEAARITSSATGGGVTAESEMAKWESMINQSQTPAQLSAALDAMALESKNRLQSNREQIQQGQKRYREISAAPTIESGGTQTAPPSGGGAPSTLPDTYNVPGVGSVRKLKGELDDQGRQLYQFPDGTKRPGWAQ